MSKLRIIELILTLVEAIVRYFSKRKAAPAETVDEAWPEVRSEDARADFERRVADKFGGDGSN